MQPTGGEPPRQAVLSGFVARHPSHVCRHAPGICALASSFNRVTTHGLSAFVFMITRHRSPFFLAFFLAMAAAAPFPEGAPPAHTGGFDEPTCTDCHFDFEENEGSGRLEIAGVPGQVQPGKPYDLEVRLAQNGLRSGGFQLTVRGLDGAQAGTLAPLDDRTAVQVKDGISYIGHTFEGTASDSEAIRWVVRWTSPSSGEGPYVIHAVGNAADADESPLGDFVYSTEVLLATPRP